MIVANLVVVVVMMMVMMVVVVVELVVILNERVKGQECALDILLSRIAHTKAHRYFLSLFELFSLTLLLFYTLKGAPKFETLAHFALLLDSTNIFHPIISYELSLLNLSFN